MSKNILKYISVILSFVLISVISSKYFILSSAEVPSSQKVNKLSGIWGPFDFDVKTDNYYVIDDPTGLTTSTYTDPTYFYTNDNITFNSIEGVKGFTGILNKITGIVIQPSNVSSFFNGFCIATGLLDTTNRKYAKNGLYDSNDNFYGYCINDISGCYYASNPNANITVSKDFSDNVYNYFNYTESNGPDYFTFYSFSDTYLRNNYNTTGLSQSQLTFLDTIFNDYNFGYNLYMYYYNGTKYFQFNNSNPQRTYVYQTAPAYAIAVNADNNNTWKQFCKVFNVDSNNQLLCTELPNQPSESASIAIYIYDSSGNQITTRQDANLATQTVSQPETFNGLVNIQAINSGWWPYLLIYGSDITIYRNSNVKLGLDNRTYSPTNYTTDSYQNYQSVTDNSFTLTYQQIDNSLTYNTEIYDNASNDYYNYYDNSFYDTSSATTNVTNITNNYYDDTNNPDNPGNPDDPNNPDNPDSPSTLEEILQAILRFFNAIGDIIGTILASLINLISAVLEALSGAIESVTGISEIFGTLFSWIPEPVPQILGAGFSICLICGIIKFIRG